MNAHCNKSLFNLILQKMMKLYIMFLYFKGVIKMKIEQMTRPRKGTFIPLAIVLLGSACAYMSADVPNPAPLFLSVCVMVFGVIVGVLETSE